MTDETRIVGNLPNLRLEIVHRQDADGMAEHVTLHMTATPSFQAAESLLMGGLSPAAWANPWALWSQMAQSLISHPLLASWATLSGSNPWIAAPTRHRAPE